MKGELNVIDRTGDTKLEWDSEKPAEVKAAREMFDALKGKGYLAYKMIGDQGYKGELIKKFDPEAERIVLAPPVAGG
jgi:hypothetical protein